MDYKTTALKKELEVTDQLIPEINGLYFVSVGEDSTLFDYTAFFQENEIDFIDHKVFMRIAKRWIEAISKQRGIATAEMFYQNKNGHILVASDLLILFLGFASADLYAYFTDLVLEALQNGVAYSNGLIFHLAAKKLPSDVLQQIIDSRNKEEQDGSEPHPRLCPSDDGYRHH